MTKRLAGGLLYPFICPILHCRWIYFIYGFVIDLFLFFFTMQTCRVYFIRRVSAETPRFPWGQLIWQSVPRSMARHSPSSECWVLQVSTQKDVMTDTPVPKKAPNRSPSELLLGNWGHHPVVEGASSHPVEEAHFGCWFLQYNFYFTIIIQNSWTSVKGGM